MTERVFTDKDLENAKREILAARRMEWPFPDAEALIHRLECAEAYILAEPADRMRFYTMWAASAGRE